MQGVARIFELEPDTILTWLEQAAQHALEVSNYLMHDLELTQVQVDQFRALLGRSEEIAPESTEQNAKKKSRKRWVWAGIDPVSKLLLACVVGDRSASCAQSLIHMIVSMLAVGCMPLFLSDQWSAYGRALLTHFGQWVETPRRSKYGPAPKPRWHPLPGLQYAQVVKKRVKGRVVSVSWKVVYGSWENIKTILSSTVGQIINTAFIERINLTIRQHVPALGRKVSSIAKTEKGLTQQLSLFRAYYNFCLPHLSLRLLLDEPQVTKNGSVKKWQERTPAQAAQITDHRFSMQELLAIRIPPWPDSAQIA